jgi:ketosteroid isomerase-like protein
MSQENIDRLRASYQVFSRAGAYDADLLAPDFELHQASSIIGTEGVFHGRKALLDLLRELQEAFEELSFEPEKFFDAPAGEIVVFVRVRGRGRGSRVETENRIAHVWTYRDDKAVRLVIYEEPAEALEAVGLSEQDVHADS